MINKNTSFIFPYRHYLRALKRLKDLMKQLPGWEGEGP